MAAGTVSPAAAIGRDKMSSLERVREAAVAAAARIGMQEPLVKKGMTGNLVVVRQALVADTNVARVLLAAIPDVLLLLETIGDGPAGTVLEKIVEGVAEADKETAEQQREAVKRFEKYGENAA